MKKIPGNAVSLMTKTYVLVFPEVSRQLAYWEEKAQQIPNPELRNQALASLQTKRFHCQGGAVFAFIAGKRYKEAVQFIVAYQTISDYLDNLCDRSTSMDAADFRLLHEAMRDALTPGAREKNYYALRREQKDGGYLTELVHTCQRLLASIWEYEQFQHKVLWLESLYADLQVHKHVTVAERVPRLKRWHSQYGSIVPDLRWYEFSAAAGSTLGIFCMVSYGLSHCVTATFADEILRAYFPYMQGLHILLDYYIDQQEDEVEGDLNFCSYYENETVMHERFQYFTDMADQQLAALPDKEFHLMVRKGLVGLYLGDAKAKKVTDRTNLKKNLLSKSGPATRFFHWNTKSYYRWK